MGRIENRLLALGLELPPVVEVAATSHYIKAVQTGSLLYTAGHGPTGMDGRLAYVGKVGADLSLEDGYAAARLTGLNLLATIQAYLKSLDRVAKVVKVLGMVNAVEGFGRHPEVINGASDLFIEVFGKEIGEHARSAVGLAGLPGNMSVEIEMILQVISDSDRE